MEVGVMNLMWDRWGVDVGEVNEVLGEVGCKGC